MATPKPRPVALKLLEGRGHGRDSGGRRIKPAVQFEREAPQAPEFLPEEAAAEWQRVVPELERLGILKPLDRAALTAYCLIWQRMVDAQADIRAGKLTTRGSQGQLVEHPSVKVFLAASRELRAWCGEFGLSPSAEGRLLMATREADDGQAGNPFARTA